MSWEERMAAKAADRRLNAWLESDEGRWVTERRTAEPWRYVPNPPDDDMCQDCYEWRSYPTGQEHFGYAWWGTCHDWPDGCIHGHEHHDGDVLLADHDGDVLLAN